MTNVLLVIGSARQGRLADTIGNYVKEEIAKHEGATVTVADLKELALPFFDSPIIPSSPDYVVENDAVKVWQKLVADADVVVLLTPEYNRGLSAIQKNAVDWLKAEWEDKKIAVVGYNWGKTVALDNLRAVLDNLKADVVEPITHLRFMQEINPDGTFIDEDAARAQISRTITDALA
jgi:NAD(P)H-dependent FMN reductase